jgi:hypothetical protein
MHLAEHVGGIVAIVLAALAAVMSSGPQYRRQVSDYIAEAFAPTIVDLGPAATVTGPENLTALTSLLRRQGIASR